MIFYFFFLQIIDLTIALKKIYGHTIDMKISLTIFLEK